MMMSSRMNHGVASWLPRVPAVLDQTRVSLDYPYVHLSDPAIDIHVQMRIKVLHHSQYYTLSIQHKITIETMYACYCVCSTTGGGGCTMQPLEDQSIVNYTE